MKIDNELLKLLEDNKDLIINNNWKELIKKMDESDCIDAIQVYNIFKQSNLPINDILDEMKKLIFKYDYGQGGMSCFLQSTHILFASLFPKLEQFVIDQFYDKVKTAYADLKEMYQEDAENVENMFKAKDSDKMRLYWNLDTMVRDNIIDEISTGILNKNLI